MGDFTSPKESDNYKKLLDFVREHSQGGNDLADSLKNLLWLLNVPAHLEMFGWVTLKVGRLLEHQKELKSLFDNYSFKQKTWNEGFITSLENWVSWYKNHQGSVNQYMGDLFRSGPESEGHPLQRRGMRRYGLYAALLCYQKDPLARKQWELLALRFILSHQYRMRGWSLDSYESYGGKSESSDMPVKLYTPAKQLRYLSEPDYSSLLCDLNSSEIVGSGGTKENDLKKNDGKKAEISTDVLLRELKGLLSFMYLSEGGEPGRKSQGRRHGSKQERDHQLGHGYVEIDERVSLHSVEVDIDDPWSDDLPLSVIEAFEEEEELSAKDMTDMDLHPSELADGDQLSLVEQECKGAEKTSFSSALAARARNKHLAIQAQLFPWRYSSLSNYQLKFVHELLREKIEILSQNMARSEDEEMTYQASLILLIMMWTGSSVDRALDISVHNQHVTDGETKLGFFDHGESQDDVRYEWTSQGLLDTF